MCQLYGDSFYLFMILFHPKKQKKLSFYQEPSTQKSILIDFDFILKALLSDRNFATLLDSPLTDMV